jgi:hypothetical protein
MARKRKHARKRSTHRRRVGATGYKGTLVEVLEIAGGAFGARLINNFAVKTFPTINPKWISLGTVAVGAFLVPKFIKSETGKNVGRGMVALGSYAALQSFGIISGVGGRRVQSKIVGEYNKNSRVVGASKKAYINADVSGVGAIDAMRSSTRTVMGSFGNVGGSLGALMMQE